MGAGGALGLCTPASSSVGCLRRGGAAVQTMLDPLEQRFGIKRVAILSFLPRHLTRFSGRLYAIPDRSRHHLPAQSWDWTRPPSGGHCRRRLPTALCGAGRVCGRCADRFARLSILLPGEYSHRGRQSPYALGHARRLGCCGTARLPGEMYEEVRPPACLPAMRLGSVLELVGPTLCCSPLAVLPGRALISSGC